MPFSVCIERENFGFREREREIKTKEIARKKERNKN
jgi:hypothetical protein